MNDQNLQPASAEPAAQAPRSGWLGQSLAAFRSRPALILSAAAAVLGLRWLLDFGGAGDPEKILDFAAGVAPDFLAGHPGALSWLVSISVGLSASTVLLSYLTDALVFASFLAAFKTGRSLLDGWRALRGRRRAVALAGLWGLPSAALGYAAIVQSKPLALAVSSLTSSAALGSLSAVAILALGLCASMVCLFGGALAAFDAARPGRSFKESGSAGLLGAWRLRAPLAKTFAAFAGGALLSALGNMAVARLFYYDATLDSLDSTLEFVGLPGLACAVVALCALLPSVEASAKALRPAVEPRGDAALAELWEAFHLWLRVLGGGSVACALVLQSPSTLLGGGLLWLWGACFAEAAHGLRDGSGGRARRALPLWAPAAALALADQYLKAAHGADIPLHQIPQVIAGIWGMATTGMALAAGYGASMGLSKLFAGAEKAAVAAAGMAKEAISDAKPKGSGAPANPFADEAGPRVELGKPEETAGLPADSGAGNPEGPSRRP